MRPIILSILIILTATVATAAPFVIADPNPATQYRVRISTDGITWGQWVTATAVSGALKFDLAATTPGNYKAEVQSGGEATVTDSTTGQVTTVVQWSASAPFLLKLAPGQKTINIRITE